MGDSRKVSNTTPSETPRTPKTADPQALTIHVQEVKPRNSLEQELKEAKTEDLQVEDLEGHPLDNPECAREKAQTSPSTTREVKTTLDTLWKTLPGANPRFNASYDSSSSESDIKPTKGNKKPNTQLPLFLQPYVVTTATTTPTSPLSPLSSQNNVPVPQEKTTTTEESSKNDRCGGCTIS